MRRQLLAVALLLTILAPLTAFAKSDNDRSSVGSDITINEDETVADVACVFCSVHIHGEVTGDVAVVFGSLKVDSGRKINGDVAVIGGDLSLGEGAEIGGDLSVIAGDANLAEGAIIHGSRTVMPGRLWLLVPFIPFLVVIGSIWLIVYFIRRRRYQFPVYPQGRGL